MVKAYYSVDFLGVICVDTFDTLKDFHKAKNKENYSSASLYDKNNNYIREVK